MTPFRYWQARVFIAGWIGYAGFYLCRKNLSVVMPILQNDRGLTKLELANVVFGYSLCYALGQFVAGPLSDRFGPRRIVTAGLGVSVVANSLMAGTGTYAWLVTLGLLNGAAQSCGWPGLVQNMGAWFPPHTRGVVMGWWTTNYVAGGFLATIFAAWAVGATPLPRAAAWQRGFLFPALLLLLVAVLFFVLDRDDPADAGLQSATTDRGTPSEHAILWRDYASLFRRRVVWITAVTAFALKVVRYSFLFWLPLYLTEAAHSTAATAGYMSSVYELAGSIGALAAGYMSDRLFGSRRFPVASLMLVGLAAACALHPLLAARGTAANLLGIALIGTMTYGPDTLMQGPASQDVGSPGIAAAAAGLICGVASLGQLVSPYLVAAVAARLGWPSVFRLFIALALVTAGISAINWKFRPSQTELSQRTAA